jgi:hypothetical protein
MVKDEDFEFLPNTVNMSSYFKRKYNGIDVKYFHLMPNKIADKVNNMYTFH